MRTMSAVTGGRMGAGTQMTAVQAEARQMNMAATERANEKARDRKDETEREAAKKQRRHAHVRVSGGGSQRETTSASI